MTRRVRGAAVAAAVVLTVSVALAACGSSGPDSSADGTRAGAATTTAATSSLPAGAEDLVGRWAHFDAVSYADASMKTVIISTGFSDLAVRGGKMWNQMTFCHADTVTDQNIQVSISDAATRAIKPVATPVTVTEEGGKLHVSRPATPTPIGIKLEDPATTKLPTDPKDPRIFDADGDGNPGVTSTVKVSDALQGEIYLARREIFAYDLTQQTADRMAGTITDRSEQLIIGASNPAFAVAAQWKQIDDPARNPVIWVRVDESWDCQKLADERAKLFPPNLKADW